GAGGAQARLSRLAFAHFCYHIAPIEYCRDRGANMAAYRRYLLAFLVLAAFAGGQAVAAEKADKVSFYFAAHEDDWQLFMNPSAFQDVLEGAAKTVFVHVTAGDAGLGTGDGGRKRPYYLARENGAEDAIRFMAD